MPTIFMSKYLQRARYIGSDARLKGQTALVRIKRSTDTNLRAQFDTIGLHIDGRMLFLGWHTFPVADFEIMGDAASVDKDGQTATTA